MKKIVLAAVISVAASAAMAGSLAVPAVPADVVIQQASTSSIDQNILPPAFFLISVGMALFVL
ncbi:MAG: hypothetical protein D6801_02280 [Alphaproteobacteria bacterium]|nr:MAG: hypothetical protein D6801_02280 [Alphaproteobacteria bacterium]